MTASDSQALWTRFQAQYTEYPELGLALDLSRMRFPDDFLARMEAPMQRAYAAMQALEAGAIANPDENRQVGHYWLRHPELAPSADQKQAIVDTRKAVLKFAGEIHSGRVKGASGPFEQVLIIGIGGSALGPQFVAKALGHPARDKMRMHFFDNTDPDGMDTVLAELGGRLGTTLCVVISKSGGTKETRNGMLEAQAAYQRAGLTFASHACAVTGEGSLLDQVAEQDKWIRRFPMWDWVGGRTSETCVVGLLPAALQGIDVEEFIKGAKACDAVTRVADTHINPAARLALMWYYSGNGKGTKDMVILPYKDRLELFSKYLQQLIMESLGKELDLDGQVVEQGIAVYGNKGSTDQHAYVQQLREGVLNFFVTFIEVLEDRDGTSMEVEPGVTSGDFLQGFFLGTRQALYEKGRESITLTIRNVSPFSVGVLIALYERAVGYYASLVNINAYHQPGVEAGKKAAGTVITVKQQALEKLATSPDQTFTAEDLAKAMGQPEVAETVFWICRHLAANPGSGVVQQPGATPRDCRFQKPS